MEFNPNNKVVRLCLQGMALEEQGKGDEAAGIFHQAWEEANTELEKFLAAHYIARQQQRISDQLSWLETALQFALKINDDSVQSAFPSLYSRIARCYEGLGEADKASLNYELAAAANRAKPTDKGPFYHGTRADIQIGELLTPGGKSNYQDDLQMNHIYFTAQVNGAGLAASLAMGDKPERVYIVEPTGSFENDPNVTDKKFPGNPTRSYRSALPLKVVGEVEDWDRISPRELAAWKERLAKNKGEIIN